MKNLLSLTSYILISFSVFCQIPNASFEEWEQIDNYEKPVYWQTNQDTISNRIIQDSLFKTDGAYSMHFVSQQPNTSQDCNNILSISFVMDDGLEENQSLYFALKLLSINPDNDVFFRVRISGIKNGQSTGIIDSSFYEEINEFELIEIPINFSEADLITLTFNGGSVNQSFNACFRRSVSWLDGLIIQNSSTTSITKIENPAIEIFPNPSFGKIELQGGWEKYQSYQVYNLVGNELENGNLQSAELNLKSKGILFLVLRSKTGNQSIFKIINQ